MCSELDIGNEAIWMKSIQNWNWNENKVIVVTKVRTMKRKEKQCNEHGYYWSHHYYIWNVKTEHILRCRVFFLELFIPLNIVSFATFALQKSLFFCYRRVSSELSRFFQQNLWQFRYFNKFLQQSTSSHSLISPHKTTNHENVMLFIVF